MSDSKAKRTEKMRYKRPALKTLGYEIIDMELSEISDACADVQYYMGAGDDTLLNALDGDDDAEYEFRIAFSDLIGKTEQLQNALCDSEVREYFDDCTVGMIGNRYQTIGYDMEEEDYFGLTRFEQELAYTESGQRIMRKTKPEIISIVGQCLGIVIAFLDLRHSYDYLKATLDILRDENTSILATIKDIEQAYDAAAEDDFCAWRNATRKLEQLSAGLPDRIWIE